MLNWNRFQAELLRIALPVTPIIVRGLKCIHVIEKAVTIANDLNQVLEH